MFVDTGDIKTMSLREHTNRCPCTTPRSVYICTTTVYMSLYLLDLDLQALYITCNT